MSDSNDNDYMMFLEAGDPIAEPRPQTTIRYRVSYLILDKPFCVEFSRKADAELAAARLKEAGRDAFISTRTVFDDGRETPAPAEGTLAWARLELTPLRMTILFMDDSGEYRVNFRRGQEFTAYYTDSINDAVATAKLMFLSRRAGMKAGRA